MSASPAPPRIHLLIGDDDRALAEALDRHVAAAADRGAQVIDAAPAMAWPFRYPLAPTLPQGPIVLRAARAHDALASAQPAHTRLVTTQAQYLFCEWEAALEAHGDACLVATLRRDLVARHAEDALKRRGVFGRAAIEEVGGAAADEPASAAAAVAPNPPPTAVETALAAAFRAPIAADRLRMALAAMDDQGSAPALVAVASACQEVNDLDSAARDLDEAIARAPDWAAPRFERGKVCLRRDDMPGAAAAFRAAAERLARYGGAWGNLGATLGELDRPDEALAAFERLLAVDPDSPQAANNVGVVTRELGRLADAEAAFRRVITLEPALAFGYYNLGHTLFLQGRYHAAATAYTEGQKRDPEKNAVQASRLAMCRLATGDARGALDELQRAARAIPAEMRQQLLADTSAILWALVTHKPDLDGWQPLHEWLNGELARSPGGGA